MKTTNWQTKALTLFIAVLALWLATACDSGYLTPYPYHYDGIRIMSSEPCDIDVPLGPSMEFIQQAETWDQRIRNERRTDDLRKLPQYVAAEETRRERLAPELKRIWQALQTYPKRLREYPYYHTSLVEELNAWNGLPTDKIVVVVYLDQFVDPRTVPAENQLPSCIAGVPVHIVVGKIFATID